MKKRGERGQWRGMARSGTNVAQGTTPAVSERCIRAVRSKHGKKGGMKQSEDIKGGKGIIVSETRVSSRKGGDEPKRKGGG